MQRPPRRSAQASDLAALKKILEQKFPGAEIRYIAQSPYFGLYEAALGDQMIYTDSKAEQILVGAIYDTATKTNLTEVEDAQAQSRRRIASCRWSSRSRK